MVVERLSRTNGVVTLCEESVLDMQTHHHCAVAAVHACVQEKHSGIVQTRVVWSVVYQVIAVNKDIASADGIVAGGAESVVHVQQYLHRAVAAAGGGVDVNNGGVVQTRVVWSVVYQVIAVNEGIAAADGVATGGAESVVHRKENDQIMKASC